MHHSTAPEESSTALFESDQSVRACSICSVVKISSVPTLQLAAYTSAYSARLVKSCTEVVFSVAAVFRVIHKCKFNDKGAT